MEKIRVEFISYYENIVGVLPSLSFAILILLFWMGLGFFLSKLIERRIRKRSHEPILRIFLVNVFKWFMFIMGMVLALDILGLSGVLGGLIAGASITAIVLGFAFKDIVENFLAGILLAFSSPFKTGDTVEIDKFRGRVVSMQLRTTHIRNFDGRDIYIPNALLMKNPLTNFTRDGLQRHSFTFGVDTATDLNQVRSLITEYLKTEKAVLKNPAPLVNTVELAEFTIEMRVSFWVNIFRTKTVDKGELGEPVLSRVIGEVKEILLKNGINMPSQVIELKGYERESPVYIEGSENTL